MFKLSSDHTITLKLSSEDNKWKFFKRDKLLCDHSFDRVKPLISWIGSNNNNNNNNSKLCPNCNEISIINKELSLNSQSFDNINHKVGTGGNVQKANRDIFTLPERIYSQMQNKDLYNYFVNNISEIRKHPEDFLLINIPQYDIIALTCPDDPRNGKVFHTTGRKHLGGGTTGEVQEVTLTDPTKIRYDVNIIKKSIRLTEMNLFTDELQENVNYKIDTINKEIVFGMLDNSTGVFIKIWGIKQLLSSCKIILYDHYYEYGKFETHASISSLREVLISSLVNHYRTKELIPHFPLFFGFYTCVDETAKNNDRNRLSLITEKFMSFKDFFFYNWPSQEEFDKSIEYLMFQGLYTLAFMQFEMKEKMIHDDLHAGNMMISEFRATANRYGNKPIEDISYFHYKVSGKQNGIIVDFHLPNPGFKLVIIDFDNSRTFDNPAIENQNIEYDLFRGNTEVKKTPDKLFHANNDDEFESGFDLLEFLIGFHNNWMYIIKSSGGLLIESKETVELFVRIFMNMANQVTYNPKGRMLSHHSAMLKLEPTLDDTKKGLNDFLNFIGDNYSYDNVKFRHVPAKKTPLVQYSNPLDVLTDKTLFNDYKNVMIGSNELVVLASKIDVK